MFIIDDILMSPAKGIMWLVNEIHKAATQEIESEAERLTAELSNLYMQLETGSLTDEEFDEREAAILDRLDLLNEAMAHAQDRQDETDDSDDEETNEPELEQALDASEEDER